MRLLHTADWHLGQRFHDQRRHDDEQFALEKILELAAHHRVDAVLVAGDIFDNANPGAEDQRRYYRTLSRFTTEAGVATVVVTGGNHDSALRLDGPRDLLADLGIQVVGRWSRDQAAERVMLPLRDRRGEVAAVCAAVPYLRDADLRLPAVGEGSRLIHQRYQQALEARYAECQAHAREQFPGMPLVVMGHCYVASANLGGGERPVQIGNLAKVEVERLAGDASYLALGHLHRPQALAGRAHWRYCGSLLPTGFDHVEVEREVIIADLPDDGGPATVVNQALEPFRRYHRLAGDAETVRQQIDALPLHHEGPQPWCEAQLRLTGPEPGLARELIDRCRERGWNLVSVRRMRQDAARLESATEDRPELRELDPEDVFVERHISRFDRPPSDELVIEFRRLLEAVTAT